MVRFVNVNLLDNRKLNFTLGKEGFYCLPCRNIEEKNLFLQILTKVSSTSGDILLEKESILKCSDKAYRTKVKSIGVVFSDYKFIEYKNIYENMKYYLELRDIRGDKAEAAIDEALEFFGESEKKYSEIKGLTHEDKVIMGLTRAMLTEPGYLVIDDIHLGTKKEVSAKILKFLEKLSRSKTAILYLSCDTDFLRENSHFMKNISEGVF